MKLDDLKPAWAMAKLSHISPGKSSEEILALLDTGEAVFRLSSSHFLWHVGVFLMLMIGCQGG